LLHIAEQPSRRPGVEDRHSVNLQEVTSSTLATPTTLFPQRSRYTAFLFPYFSLHLDYASTDFPDKWLIRTP
jgi:hypothetical protein